jgi:hypothetical protein
MGSWTDDDVFEVINYIKKHPDLVLITLSYQDKIERLARVYPAVAAAKAHLDAMVAMVEHGE